MAFSRPWYRLICKIVSGAAWSLPQVRRRSTVSSVQASSTTTSSYWAKVAVQLRRHRAAELHRTGPVVMQVDHGGDKVFFLIVDTTHSSSTSSKS